MSVLINGANTYLATTLGAAMTIGTGAYNVATMVCRKGTITAEADLFFIGVDRAGTFPNVGVYFSATSNQLVGTYGSESTVGAYTLTQDVWYWAVMSRAGTGAGQARLRVFTMDGTKVHQTTGTDGGTYSAMDNIWYGESGMGYPTANAEVCNGKVATGAEWSDEQCVVEMRHFGCQVAASMVDRYCFRLEDVTDTFDGLRSMPEAGMEALALTNSGGVNGASRPSALEPLGLRIRQVAHYPTSDASPTSFNFAFAANVLGGSTIDVSMQWESNPQDTSGYGVSDGVNGAYTEVPSSRIWGSSQQQTAAAFYFPNSGAGAVTVTCSFGGARQYVGGVALEIAGADTTAPLGAYNASNNADTLTTTPTAGAVVPATPGHIVVGTMVDYSNGSFSTITYPTGARVYALAAGFAGVDTALYTFQRRTAHSYTPAVTLSVSRKILYELRTYKPAVFYGKGDNFNRTAENPLSDGGTWGGAGGGLVNLKTNGTQAVGVTNVTDAAMRRTDTSAGNDQWGAAVINGNLDMDVVLRMDGAGNGLGLSPYNPSQWMYFNAGAYTNIVESGVTFAAADEMYIEVVGTARIVAAWKNGVLVDARTLANGPTSGGAPGLFVYSDGDRGQTDAWAGGGLWDDPSPPVTVQDDGGRMFTRLAEWRGDSATKSSRAEVPRFPGGM